MAQPFFSIVIPTFNSERFLRSCLASLSGQSEQDFEVIIVDKNSCDETLAIFDSFCFKRCKKIQQKSSSLPEALDEGFAISQGLFLCWLNSDDLYCRPNSLSLIRQALQGVRPDDAFCYSNHICIDVDGLVVSLNASHWQTSKSERAIGGLNLCTGALFFSRSLYLAFGGFGSRYGLAFEYPLIDFLMMHGRSIYVPSYIHAYRLHGAQLSNLNSGLMAREVAVVDSSCARASVWNRLLWAAKRLLSNFLYSNFVSRFRWRGKHVSVFWRAPSIGFFG